jgi:hypothetical protein
MIHIVHNENFLRYSFASDEKIKELFALQPVSDFTLVAQVKTDDLNIAYRQTNNIEENWCDNPDVIPFQKECRSTSVGDLFITRTNWFIVATCGFVEVPSNVEFFKELCKKAYPAEI